MITITHEHSNIFLKQPKMDELDYVAWLWSDENTMESVGGPRILTVEQRADWYKRMVIPGDGQNFYCLIYTNENEKVGEVSFHQFNEAAGTAHLNVKIAGQHRGKGYGRQAVLLILDYYFNMFGGRRMLDNVNIENDAAQILLEKCGFEKLEENNEAILFSLSKDRFDMLYSE